MKRALLYGAAATTALILGGCGGGGGGDTASTATDTTPTATANAGVFIDSRVSGLEYVGSLGTSGVTDELGRFYFKNGEIVTFKIGNVIVGEAAPTAADYIVTPSKIVEYKTGTIVADINDTKILNMVRFLISADTDLNATNGITISDALRELLNSKPPLRLDEDQQLDTAILQSYLERAAEEIADENEAYEHYLESLTKIEEEKDEIEKEVQEYEDEYEEDEYTTIYPDTGKEYTLIAWNDLGMHCMDDDYSVFSILPPYNTLVAQLIKRGEEPQIVTSGVIVTYEAAPSLEGKYNTTSYTKTNFWDYVLDLFGIEPAVDVGLKGYEVQSYEPKEMEFNPAYNWFAAEGIPTVPYNDDNTTNHYPLVKVVAKDSNGNVLAETTTVLPVSDEMDCKKCHASDSGYLDARPTDGWVYMSDPKQDYKYNILKLHDEKFPDAVSNNYDTLLAKGYDYNTTGLVATAQNGKSILCASCHGSNALPGSGIEGISPLTKAMHSKHADVKDPYDTNLTLNDSTNRNACYSCHPGAQTQCLRGAMGKAKDSNGLSLIQCQDCHGSMSAVGSPTREGWFDEPNCQSCHQNGQRYTSAVTDYQSGTLKEALDTRFATSPDTPLPGKRLYRFSKGHGGLQCSACHGSTHAIYPSIRAEDNIQSISLQGYAGTVSDCSVCHTSVPLTADKGPHGIHTIGQNWVQEHEDAAKNNLQSCSACHGGDYRGSDLSKTFTVRTFYIEDGETKTFPAGHKVSCYDCHNGPYGDEYEEDDED